MPLEGRGFLSSRKWPALASLHTALSAESAHEAPRPSGRRESATENQPVLENEVDENTACSL